MWCTNLSLFGLLLEHECWRFTSGADPNASTPVIGSPLHLACADRVPHRAELVQILLSNGADPNLLVHADEVLTLRPPIAEYVASSEVPNAKIVAMLLRYGARVSTKPNLTIPNLTPPCLTPRCLTQPCLT